jgi:glycosyltransferase involved in cell wall biosynthesis
MQEGMKKLIAISFTPHPDFEHPEEMMEAFRQGWGYIKRLGSSLEVVAVGFIRKPKKAKGEEVTYAFFKRKDTFWQIPWSALLFIRSQRPDVVLIEGLIHPIQTLCLRALLPRNSVIIAQDHGNLPFEGLRKPFQRLSARAIDAFVFTALGNTQRWKDSRVIRKDKPCFEVLEGVSDLTPRDKELSKARLDMKGDFNLLWVGRLESNKDPLTVVRGFADYLRINPLAQLYMIYGERRLLMAVMALVEHDPILRQALHLVGFVAHRDLDVWFSAADAYVSGSHREGSGFALIESMSCGCVPVVTDIPSFRKISGKYGFLWKAGEASSLCAALDKAYQHIGPRTREDIIQFAAEEHSLETVTRDMLQIIQRCTRHHGPSDQ